MTHFDIIFFDNITRTQPKLVFKRSIVLFPLKKSSFGGLYINTTTIFLFKLSTIMLHLSKKIVIAFNILLFQNVQNREFLNILHLRTYYFGNKIIFKHFSNCLFRNRIHFLSKRGSSLKTFS